MILYLDTSALVKVFVSEPYSDRVREAVAAAQLTITHAISYVETCAAFARAAHARRNHVLFSALRRNLDVQWKAWDIVDATEALLRRAADLAWRYRLRGYDSVHLAAAESTAAVFRDQVPFYFLAFDKQLNDAAKQADIPLLGA